MDALSALTSRRSIRRYTAETVSGTDVDAIVRAALCAPTAFSQHAARIVVVRDRDRLAALAETHKHAWPIADAACALVVCGDTRVERFPGFYWEQDATAALENALTAATALGLGTCWIGVHPWPDRTNHVREAVGLPIGVQPLGLVAIGHPAETKPARDVDLGHVHQDRWTE